MRIISQNGDIDAPYEDVMLKCSGKSIIMSTGHGFKDFREIARYSTHDRAMHALYMLHNGYILCKNNIFQFPDN